MLFWDTQDCIASGGGCQGLPYRLRLNWEQRVAVESLESDR